MKRTHWFPRNIKPVRIGAYETECNQSFGGMRRLDWWDGKRWVLLDGTKCHAIRSTFKSFRWRGLAAQVAVGKKAAARTWDEFPR